MLWFEGVTEIELSDFGAMEEDVVEVQPLIDSKAIDRIKARGSAREIS
jgi:hypothetical protein